jgi:hypothetical protein
MKRLSVIAAGLVAVVAMSVGACSGGSESIDNGSLSWDSDGSVPISDTFPMPNFYGVSGSVARQMLKSYGLESFLIVDYNNIVCKQDPSPGTPVERGSTVLVKTEQTTPSGVVLC